MSHSADEHRHRTYTVEEFAAKRSLYGIEQLAACPDAVVLLVGSAKEVDAIANFGMGEAFDFAPRRIVGVTYPNNAQAVADSDLTKFVGREVIVIARNNPSGKRAADVQVEALRKAGAGTVRRWQPPPEIPQGWAVAADPLPDGVDPDALVRSMLEAPMVEADEQPPPDQPDEYVPWSDEQIAAQFAEGAALQPSNHGRATRRLKLTYFRELTVVISKKWIVKGVIAIGEISSWIGPPGGWKSALLTDIAIYVARGGGWRNYRGKGRFGVVYFALERGDLVKRRLVAYRRRDNLPGDLPIAVISQVLDLMHQDCVGLIIDAIRNAEQDFGCKVGLVIIDTYAKGIAAGRGDENAAKDQGIVIANLRRVIDQMPDIHIAGIGHTGKDPKKGERGSNAKLADVDVLVQIAGDAIKTATVEKGNDQPEGALTSFKLEPHDFDPDEDGDPFRTFIVSKEIIDAVTPGKGKGTTPLQKNALNALTEVTLSRGREPPAEYGLPHGVKVVTAEEWKTELLRRHVIDPEGENPRARFKEMRTKLQAKQLIGIRDDYVWSALRIPPITTISTTNREEGPQ
jgi:hypothetical protein